MAVILIKARDSPAFSAPKRRPMPERRITAPCFSPIRDPPPAMETLRTALRPKRASGPTAAPTLNCARSCHFLDSALVAGLMRID
ncbi:MAG: hypothetical protein B7Z67_00475 [Acidiphilium sp. 21-60-14]|nr:MAG: hypothetical protein B7Z67_00475 [Acidiphilium sp. 21-60-14]OYV92197.1 MAG: hypothetical protein B7Z57_01320 [Acidiphilium sp. 37-60-79]OZB40618.1 MAG: hypothetical protein B7X48_04490 [Acidiphilium sp. 34-60-192]